nr:hypothetical protein BaRGS_005303 [Batillaria attramentaria]
MIMMQRKKALHLNLLFRCARQFRGKSMYFFVMCMMVVTSTFAIVAGTHSSFQRELTPAEREYYGEHSDLLTSEEHKNHSATNNGNLSNAHNDTQERDHSKFYQEVDWLGTLTTTTNAFFTVDYLLRCMFLPHLRLIVCDPINVTDGLALLATLIKYLIENGLPKEKLTGSHSDVFNMLLLLRIFRFLRPMSKIRGFRVLYYTLKCSFLELTLVFTVTLLLVTVFASLLYYCGDRQSMKSIPDAMWYALVTMTTVGYGDVVPMEFRTKLIGSMCMLIGVVLISMTMPIIVSNFLTLYANSKIKPVTI